MSMMDNFRKNFGLDKGSKSAGNSGTGSGPEGGSADTHAPGGLNERPDGGAGAATLNKKPVVIGAAVIALAAAGAWAGFTMMTHTKVDVGGNNRLVPGRAVNVPMPPPPPAPKSTPQPTSASSPAPTKAKKTKTASASQTHHASHQHQASNTHHNPTPQDKAEQTAFSQSMLVQNGGGAWQQHGAKSGKDTGSGAAGKSSAKDNESGAAIYDAHIEHRPASPYELMAGSDIPAVLTTAIQSDLPGQITAQVSRNVYDSESGAYLLIPAGAKLVGYYSNKVIAGQTRVGVDWTRIIMPDGAYINLGKMPGAGPSGKDGLHDLVNDHTWEIFKNALLMSVIDLGISVSQPGYGSAGGYGQQAVTPAQQGESSLMQTFGQAEANILQKYTNIAPTLTIRSGYQLNVAVTKDVLFPRPYDTEAGPAYRGPSAPSSIAPATEMDPYPAGGQS